MKERKAIQQCPWVRIGKSMKQPTTGTERKSKLLNTCEDRKKNDNTQDKSSMGFVISCIMSLSRMKLDS